jgi:hypothetical protein
MTARVFGDCDALVRECERLAALASACPHCAHAAIANARLPPLLHYIAVMTAAASPPTSQSAMCSDDHRTLLGLLRVRATQRLDAAMRTLCGCIAQRRADLEELYDAAVDVLALLDCVVGASSPSSSLSRSMALYGTAAWQGDSAIAAVANERAVGAYVYPAQREWLQYVGYSHAALCQRFDVARRVVDTVRALMAAADERITDELIAKAAATAKKLGDAGGDKQTAPPPVVAVALPRYDERDAALTAHAFLTHALTDAEQQRQRTALCSRLNVAAMQRGAAVVLVVVDAECPVVPLRRVTRVYAVDGATARLVHQAAPSLCRCCAQSVSARRTCSRCRHTVYCSAQCRSAHQEVHAIACPSKHADLI